MQLIAKKDFPYNSRQLKAGDAFEPVSDAQGEAMVVIGLARKPDIEPMRTKRAYRRRDMVAEGSKGE